LTPKAQPGDIAGVVLDEVRHATDLMWLGNAPVAHSFEVVTDYTAPDSGPIELGWSVIGSTTLEVDGHVVLEADLEVAPEDVDVEGGALLEITHREREMRDRLHERILKNASAMAPAFRGR